MFLAAVKPLTWPGSTSTTERAPETSVTTVCTPTSSYLAMIRFFGLGSYSGDTRPSEVESPMWATARHAVRSGPLTVGHRSALDLPFASAWALADGLATDLVTDLVTGSCSDPAASTEPGPLPSAGPCTTPDRPTPATISTAVVPAVAARPP